MKPSEFKILIKALVKSGAMRPVFIEGSPGLGKTEIAGQVAREMGDDWGLMHIHCPTLQVEDSGMPVIYGENRDKLKFVVSADKFPIEGSMCPEFGIFLIDELPQADPAIQKMLANVVQEREIHGHKLKKGWFIIATGNRVKDKSGANRLLGHLSNKLTRLTMEPCLDDWCKWALDNGVKTELVSFIRFKPELLSEYDPNREINPTPRAWVQGVNARLGKIPSEFEPQLFAGDVGGAAAGLFLHFLKIWRELPNPDAIILNPLTERVPPEKDSDIRYATVGALIARVNENNFGRILSYIKRLPAEYSMWFNKDAVLHCPNLTANTDFIKWITTDGANLGV